MNSYINVAATRTEHNAGTRALMAKKRRSPPHREIDGRTDGNTDRYINSTGAQCRDKCIAMLDAQTGN